MYDYIRYQKMRMMLRITQILLPLFRSKLTRFTGNSILLLDGHESRLAEALIFGDRAEAVGHPATAVDIALLGARTCSNNMILISLCPTGAANNYPQQQ